LISKDYPAIKYILKKLSHNILKATLLNRFVIQSGINFYLLLVFSRYTLS